MHWFSLEQGAEVDVLLEQVHRVSCCIVGDHLNNFLKFLPLGSNYFDNAEVTAFLWNPGEVDEDVERMYQGDDAAEVAVAFVK